MYRRAGIDSFFLCRRRLARRLYFSLSTTHLPMEEVVSRGTCRARRWRILLEVLQLLFVCFVGVVVVKGER